MSYVELNAITHFSFLRGVSSAEDLFSAARLLGYGALGITDRNTVGGLVRALIAADKTKVRLIAGCRHQLSCEAAATMLRLHIDVEHIPAPGLERM